MDPNPTNFPILSYVMAKLPNIKRSFSNAAAAAFDVENPPSPPSEPQEPYFELSEKMPHLNNPKLISAMRSTVSDVAETRSVLKALGTRPDHEAVVTAQFKLSELNAHSSRGPEEFNEDCKMCKAVITLDEMHGAYEKMLGEAERRLEMIYEAAVAGKGDNFIEVEEGGENVEEAEEMNEEVSRILNEAKSRKGIERVDLSERKLRALPEAFGRLASLVVLNLSNNQLEVDEAEEGDELVDDEGEDDFEFETNDLEHEDNQMLGVTSNDLKSSIQQVFDIERNDLGDDGGQILSIGGGHMLEFGTNGHHINSVQILEIPGNDHNCRGNQFPEIHGNDNLDTIDDGSGDKSCHPPAMGMEFESYDDAYNYYNCYSKELGFGIRVKSSWTKRSSKEKRGAVLCCNCEGFKATKEAITRRKETRTGCPAMIRLRLMESNRWRLDEVKTEHNHLLDHERAQNSRSHMKIDAGAKRKLESAFNIEVQTIKLYRTFCADAVSYQSSNEKEISNHVQQATHLKLRGGDVLALHEYFHREQLVDPKFFYVMDFSDEGCLKTVFWISSRSRAAYSYFGDVVVVDTTYLSKTYIVPLLTFTGLNHHDQSVLLGCGFVVDETMETYIWLMRAWLTCVLGRPPQTIITDKSKALCGAISVVFPRANHCLCLPSVMQYICEKVGEMRESSLIQTLLNRAVYNSMKVEDFEKVWEEMIQHFSIRDHEWLRTLYEDRERWVPVYLKDTFFAGIYTSQPDENMCPFFHGYLHEQTTWTEFFNFYEFVQQNKIHRESLNDLESRDFRPVLRTSCNYELQLSEVYTKDIFLRFQEEVVLMANCFHVTQIRANGTVITYMVNEWNTDGDSQESRNFEVMFDKVGLEVRCICSCFNFRGYLCRHALTVLNHNGFEEIPNMYILTRWRKDVKRIYSPDLGSNTIDITNPVQWYDYLSRRAMQVVAEGITTQDRYMVARQAFRDSLNKVRLVEDKHV